MFYLNSLYANKYFNNQTSDCLFHLPQINVKKSKNIIIAVQTAQIPYSFYNVNSTNDELVYSVNGESQTLINITHQNYNVNTLKKKLLSHLGGNFTISYNSNKNKYTFTHSMYNFVFESSSNCFELLGFTDNSDNASTNSILFSSNSCNLFTIRNLYITSNNFILNNINSINANQTNILISIPINSVANSMISYSNIYNSNSQINHVDNLTNLHITIVDQDNSVIKLNNCHWSLTLELIIT
jgi:hypothetical protein